MNMAKIEKNIDDIEREVTKCNKILAKGEKMSLGDAIKLGRKTNSIASTIRKNIKTYEVSTACWCSVPPALTIFIRVPPLPNQRTR